MSLYDELGVAPDASPEEIKRAHRQAAKATHPDNGGSPEAFHRVQRAYGILSDQRRRARYDETGQEEEMRDPEAALRAAARSIVMRQLTALIKDPNVDPRSFDLVLGVRELIDGERRHVEQSIATIRAMQARLKQFARRLKRKAKEGQDQVIPMLEKEIAAGDRQVGLLEQDQRELAAADALAREYVYETDPMQQVHVTTLIIDTGRGPVFRGGF